MSSKGPYLAAVRGHAEYEAGSTMDDQIRGHADRLVEFVRQFPSCLVAYSGGVDSAVIVKAAQLALGERALAVTGVSASLADGELEAACRLAEKIGIRHETVDTDELSDPNYLRNSPDRCFHCKTELYSQLKKVADHFGLAEILNGANADDLGDFRPGIRAAQEHGVHSPLAECGFDKSVVRAIARHWGLAAWDKPAMPCLSSRVVYGLEITPERLARIDAAEHALRGLGLKDVRVRLHPGELARLEVPVSALVRLCEEPVRTSLVAELRRLGFAYVAVDLEGFRSGSFKHLVPVEELVRFAAGARPETSL